MGAPAARGHLQAVPDGDLVELHRGGDLSAFEMLYRRYYRRLVALCAARGRDLHLAEDLAQETMLRALKYLDSFDPNRSLWPWLRSTAVRVVIDHHSRDHHDDTEIANADAQDLEEEFEEVDPDHAPEVNDSLYVAWLLSHVPERHRAALIAHYLEERSLAEAAAWFGLTPNSYKQLLFRARERLRACDEPAVALAPAERGAHAA